MIRRVRARCDLYGNPTSQWAVVMTNLTRVPAGTLGVIEDDFWDADSRCTVCTVRFPDGIYVNVNRSVLEDVNDET